VTSPETFRWKQQGTSARGNRARALTLAAKAARKKRLFIVPKENQE
jgi:hypothetical protein